MDYVIKHSLVLKFQRIMSAVYALLTRHRWVGILLLCILVVRHWLALGHVSTAPMMLVFWALREVMYISRVWWECWKYILHIPTEHKTWVSLLFYFLPNIPQSYFLSLMPHLFAISNVNASEDKGNLFWDWCSLQQGDDAGKWFPIFFWQNSKLATN